MENCEYMQELISRMLDEELDAQEQAALSKHLESCAECRAVYEAFAAVSGALREQLEEPPESLCENVMAEIRRDEIKKKNRRPYRAALTVAAAVVLVIGLRFGPGMGIHSAQMSASVQDFSAVSEEETVAETATVTAEAAKAEPAAGSSAIFSSARSSDAGDTAMNSAAEPMLDTVEEAACEAALESSPAIDLSGSLRFAELLERLAGEKVDLHIERLGDVPALTVRCTDGELALFAYEGALIYYSPADEALLRTACGEAEIRAFA